MIRKAPSGPSGPPAKFAKVLIRDENGENKTVLIPADKLPQLRKAPAAKEVEDRMKNKSIYFILS